MSEVPNTVRNPTENDNFFFLEVTRKIERM